MWADAESDVDFLNYTEVAELACEMIGTPSLLPLSLGIFGTWGTGKSSILRLMRAELMKPERGANGEGRPAKYLVVDFDAWLYQGFDDAKAALMAVIAKALFDASPETLWEKAAGLVQRAHKLKMLGLIAEGGAAALGVPTFGLISRGLSAVGDYVGPGTHKDEDEKAVEGGIEDAKKRAEGLLEAKKSDRRPKKSLRSGRSSERSSRASTRRSSYSSTTWIDAAQPPRSTRWRRSVSSSSCRTRPSWSRRTRT